MKRFIAIFGLALGVATPASADFLYTFNVTFSDSVASYSGQLQFTEPALLTSPTTVSSFLTNTLTATNASGSALANSICAAPMAGQTCSLFGVTVPGPNVEVAFLSPINIALSNPLPPFTSTGTFTNSFATLVITSQAAVPEPSALLLLATALGALALIRIRRRSS